MIRLRRSITGSAIVNFDRSFRALSNREDSMPCVSAQRRDVKEDEGCGEKEEGNGYMFHCICLEECDWISRHFVRGFDFVCTVISPRRIWYSTW